MSAPRICHVGRIETASRGWHVLERARRLGFDTVLAAPGNRPEGMATLAQACESRGLSLFLDLDLYELDLSHPLVESHPECFAVRHAGDWNGPVDPRDKPPTDGKEQLRRGQDLRPIVEWWSDAIEKWLRAGVRGFRAIKPATSGATLWDSLIGIARSHGANRVIFIADTPGEARDGVLALAESGFDHCLSSLPWWDGRASWLVDEYAVLSRVAPVIAQVESPTKLPPASSVQRCGRLALAAMSGTGIMMPLGFADPALEDSHDRDLERAISAANAFVSTSGFADGSMARLTGAGAPLTILMRADTPDPRTASRALVAIVNANPVLAAEPSNDLLSLLGEFNRLSPALGNDSLQEKLEPHEVRLLWAERGKASRARSRAAPEIAAAVQSPRVVIENLSPAVEAGAFAAKRIVGDQVPIQADIYTDGHPVIAAELQFRAEGEHEWRRVRMQPKENDRWRAVMPLDRIGRHEFAIEAWIDSYGSFVRDIRRKFEAGLDLHLEISEGRQLIEAAGARESGSTADALKALLRGFDFLPARDRLALLLAPETTDLMHKADGRPFAAKTAAYAIEAERRSAMFGSWYELFPRSQTDDPKRHGTLRDVIAQLSRIRDMGFDVLYLPPIYPVGETNRKGRNNALTAVPGDLGSVYAIGSEAGGHDAIHPELGTLEDFRALVSAAHENGIEIALDFAIQTSPDHPWLKEHPGWFDWRPDGSIKYAENPPKKYEDIVNIDFYARDAVPGLWLALRNIVLFWIEQGVKIFRVDNPHTKPFAFWQWMIADIRSRHPDVIFLSEAFTRPKPMYHLAKLGFSQSYTYFTWRNTKHELTEYVKELTSPPVSDFFRPHFFVNTPDINPYFLQSSGRAGFLIRAALATTLSGLWGMYSGFELCESTPLPDREEYLDSEKYEIKIRDWNAPGNIVAEITQLNRLRKAEPALQSHLGPTFYNAFNENILYYGKKAPGHRDRILVAVNLDPHHTQEADFEIPLWEFGLADHEALDCEDLIHGGHWMWHGKIQHMRLTAEAPYAIWRVMPAKDT
ncbi:MAG TPA: maltotransferase domain-containing protein [Rhizomicrobium sp.]|nr:maltotransferase domain-containing protein [Rhizomicrobium sp.]